MNAMSILGVTVHDISLAEARAQCANALLHGHEGKPFRVYTPNPEIILHAVRDTTYRDILNRADLALPDGRGLKIAHVHNRVTGVAAAEELLALANTERKRVCCVVRWDGRSGAGDVQAAVKKLAPQAKIQVVSVSKADWQNRNVLSEIQSTKPDILLIGLGFPEQEQWIDRYAHEIPFARITMAVGGTFDFWTGVAKRAPQLMQNLGFEWLWRLAHQPKRIGRIWNAVVVFPFTYWVHRRQSK